MLPLNKKFLRLSYFDIIWGRRRKDIQRSDGRSDGLGATLIATSWVQPHNHYLDNGWRYMQTWLQLST